MQKGLADKRAGSSLNLILDHLRQHRYSTGSTGRSLVLHG